MTADNLSTGIVKRLDGDFAWVEIVGAGNCGSCQSKAACGSGSGFAGISLRPSEYRLPNSIDARPGDAVSIVMPHGSLLRAAVLAYLMPLALGIGGAVAGLHFGGGDGRALAGLVGGLLLGLILLRRASGRFALLEPMPRLALQSPTIPALHKVAVHRSPSRHHEES